MTISYTHIVNGLEVNPPFEWQQQQIKVDFRRENSLSAFGGDTPLIDLGTLIFVNDGGDTFTNKAAKVINDYVDGGADGTTNGLFENITYKITASFIVNNVPETFTFFDGYLEMETYRRISDIKVEIEARAFKDINALVTKVRANSFGFLESINVIGASDYVDIDVVVESQDDAALLFALETTIVLMAIQLAQAVKSLATDLVNITAHTAGGVTGPFAGGLMLLGLIIIDTLFIRVLIKQIGNLLVKIAVIVLPPLLTYKATLLRTLLEKAVSFIGFNLISPIPELDSVAYLPSKPNSDFDIIDSVILSIQGNPFLESGIPRPDDFGYYISDFFTLIERKYNAKFDVIGNDLHIRSENDPFWKSNSTFKPRPISDIDITVMDQKSEERIFNIQDWKANTLISFATDSSDSWTSAYFKGTNFEIIASLNNEIDPRLAKKGGLRKIEIPLALGNRKSQLTDVEEAVAFVTDIIVVQLKTLQKLGLDIPSDLVKLIDIRARIGALRVSQKVHNVAKLIFLGEDGKIPPNHRELLSGRALWDSYWNEISFVDNNFGGQKQIVTNQPLPFTAVDFVNILDKSFFVNDDGADTEVKSILWTPDDDKAVMNSEITLLEPNKSISETFVEPG